MRVNWGVKVGSCGKSVPSPSASSQFESLTIKIDFCVPPSMLLKVRCDVDKIQMPRQRLCTCRPLGMHAFISAGRLRKRRPGARPGSSVISSSLQASPLSTLEVVSVAGRTLYLNAKRLDQGYLKRHARNAATVKPNAEMASNRKKE